MNAQLVRHPAGTSSGGKFAPTDRPEADEVTVGAEPQWIVHTHADGTSSMIDSELRTFDESDPVIPDNEESAASPQEGDAVGYLHRRDLGNGTWSVTRSGWAVEGLLRGFGVRQVVRSATTSDPDDDDLYFDEDDVNDLVTFRNTRAEAEADMHRMAAEGMAADHLIVQAGGW